MAEVRVCEKPMLAARRRWNGAELDHNQDGARQTLCDYLDGVGGAASLFDFPMKGILQARAPPPRVCS